MADGLAAHTNVQDISTCTVALPADVLPYILGFLHDNKEALAACSLVSHLWSPLSRSHVFSSILTRDHNTNFAYFTSFVKSTPQLASHIRDLELLGYHLDHYEPYAYSASATTLSGMLRWLFNLQTLTCTNLSLGDGPRRRAASPSGIKFSLKSLTLVRCGIKGKDKTDELLATLSIFSQIDNLVLRKSFFVDAQLEHRQGLFAELERVSLLIPAALKVGSFVIRDNAARTNFLLEMIGRMAGTVGVLKKLDVASVGRPWRLRCLGDLLRRLPPGSLEELSVDISLEEEPIDCDALCTSLNLASPSLESLKSFTLRHAPPYWNHAPFSWHTFCLVLLSLPPTSTLTNLTLCYRFAHEIKYWPLFRDVVVPYFKFLQKLTIVIPDDIILPDEVAARLEKQLRTELCLDQGRDDDFLIFAPRFNYRNYHEMRF